MNIYNLVNKLNMSTLTNKYIYVYRYIYKHTSMIYNKEFMMKVK